MTIGDVADGVTSRASAELARVTNVGGHSAR